MPAARPRMHVTPSESVHVLIRELSRLTGKPPATLVRELLDEARPALELAVQAFRDMQRRPAEAQAAFARLAAMTHQTVAQASLDLDSAMRRKPGRKPRKGAADPG